MQTLLLSLIVMGAHPAEVVTAADAASSACCEGEDCGGHAHRQHVKPPHAKLMGPAPQTCYQPRYGCYPAPSRFSNRYPAFHGTFYSKSYNYRNYFDYPHHAELHEPTSLFSYHTERENGPATPEQPPAPISSYGETPAVPVTPTVPDMSFHQSRFSETQPVSLTAAATRNFAPVVRASAVSAPAVSASAEQQPAPIVSAVKPKTEPTVRTVGAPLRTLRR